MPNKWLMLGLGVLVALFFLFRPPKRASNVDLSSTSGRKEEAVQAEEKTLEQEVGMKSVSITPGQLSLKFRPKKACSGGDLDALKVELEGNKDRNLLLSVESMDGVAFPAGTTQVSLDDLTQGFRHRFDLPKNEAPYQVGIYLCRDRKGQKSCSGKPFVDINKLFQRAAARKSPYNIAHGTNKTAQDEDVIYFYQYAMVEGGQARVFQDFQVSPLAYRKLGRYVNSRKGEGASGAEVALERAKSLSETLKSLPLQSDSEDLIAELPYFDASACNEKSAQAQLPASPFKMAEPSRIE